MKRQVTDVMDRRWIVILCILSLGALLVNFLIFFPGYMSPDSIDSLSQAKGLSVLNDWHPPIFALVWRVLIKITGTVSTMLFVQLSMEWFVLFMLSVYIYRRTEYKRLSVAVLLIGFLPMVLGVSGVIWKDVQMANLLGMATVLLLVFQYVPKRWYRITLLSIILFIIEGAFLLRYNVVFALVPLVYLAFRIYGGIFLRVHTAIIATVMILIMMGSSSLIIGAVFNVKKTNPISAIMLDDVIHIRSPVELKDAPVSSPLKNALIETQIVCNQKRVVVNGYIACANSDEKLEIPIHYQDLKSYWTQSLISRPFSYISYRIYAFSFFIFAPQGNAYVYQDGIIKNDLGQDVRFKDLGEALHIYVIEFGYRHFSFLFEAWFWLTVASVFLWYGRRLKKTAFYTATISLSAIIYIASYAPVVVAADYRYVYWPVIATLICGIVLLAEVVKRKARV